jgi:GcrA cell cycle regulator
MGKRKWTPTRVERLFVLLQEGLSSRDIARCLADEETGLEVTRNAVIGKVHRLGLSLLGSGSNQYKSRGVRTPRPRIPRKPVPAKTGNTPAPASLNVPVVQMVPESAQCRWPLGDPRHPEAFGYCHHPRLDDRHSYCDTHTRLAYVHARVH